VKPPCGTLDILLIMVAANSISTVACHRQSRHPLPRTVGTFWPQAVTAVTERQPCQVASRATESRPPEQATTFPLSPVSNTAAHVLLISMSCLHLTSSLLRMSRSPTGTSPPPPELAAPQPLSASSAGAVECHRPRAELRRQCPESRPPSSFTIVQCFPSETTRATIPRATSLR
jgi:hypothetical protein